MKKLVLIFLAILVVSSAQSQVRVENDSQQPVWVAIAYYESNSNFSGWVSTGWWKIIPGETKTCGGSFLKDGENTYYLHAHSEGYAMTWGDEINLAVNKVDAFTLQNCDKDYVLSGDNIGKVGFDKHFVHIGLLDSYKDYVRIVD